MLKKALEIAASGYRVFPLQDKGKRPRRGFTEWQNKATTDETTIKMWWKKWPNANIAIACGKESGIFSVDIDGPTGEESWEQLCSEIPDIPQTLEQKTGRAEGGRQKLFAYPEDREVRNKEHVRPKVDVRGEGGYIVAPPSIHPDTGTAYKWLVCVPPATAPEALLDVLAPISDPQVIPPKRPWDEGYGQDAIIPSQKPPEKVGGTPVIERASLYLREIEPAVKGAGGHKALLWAARAMVIGFNLTDAEALSLLWNEYNHRCTPPWDYGSPSERKDFERKVSQARETPGKLNQGWALVEFNLLSDEESLKMGAMMAANITGAASGAGDPGSRASTGKISAGSRESSPEASETFVPFPAEVLPPKIRDYVRYMARSQNVDESFIAIPVLAGAAIAMGNAFRIRPKHDWLSPPNIWGAIIAPPSQNKSRPMKMVLAPVKRKLRPEEIDDATAPLNPQGRLTLGDATVAAVIRRMELSPRGCGLIRDELAGWALSFDAHKKNGGGDEQAYIEFWSGSDYQLDRKTDNEEVVINSASLTVVGSIQPKTHAKCMGGGRFDSGLVQRLLIAYPPKRGKEWIEELPHEDLTDIWANAITWLRTRPFASLDPDVGFVPNVLELDAAAKKRFKEYFFYVGDWRDNSDEISDTFIGKSDEMAARITLQVRGLWLATEGGNISDPIPVETVESGITIAKWFTCEQLRVYGLSSKDFREHEIAELVRWVRSRLGESVSPRDVNRANGRKYRTHQDAREMLDKLASEGAGTWDTRRQIFTLNKEEK